MKNKIRGKKNLYQYDIFLYFLDTPINKHSNINFYHNYFNNQDEIVKDIRLN